MAYSIADFTDPRKRYNAVAYPPGYVPAGPDGTDPLEGGRTGFDVAVMGRRAPSIAAPMVNGSGGASGQWQDEEQPAPAPAVNRGPYGAAMSGIAGGDLYGTIARAFARGQRTQPATAAAQAALKNRAPLSDPSTELENSASRVDTDNLNRSPATAAIAAGLKPMNYAAPGGVQDGWAGRNAIRGGAAPSTLDQGSGIAGTRGNWIPAGVGGTPGTQIQSDYGYGDVVTATADKNGRFTQFSGTGGGSTGKPNPADYAAGLARAAADREKLAQIEAERTALPVAGIGDLSTTRGDARLDGSQNIGSARGDPRLAVDAARANADIANTKANTRATSQNIVTAAGAQPYAIANLGAGVGQAQANTAHTQAQTGQIGVQTEASRMQLQQQKDLDALRQKALASGKQEDMDRYSQAVRAAAGKGGNLTQEDLVKAYTEYLVAHTKANAMSSQAPQPLDFQTFTSGISGKLTPETDPRALSIRAQLQSGKIDRDEARRQWAALGYQ